MTKPITYGDLKDQIGQPYPRPFLHCPGCDIRLSANAGDYWDRDKAAGIVCGCCDHPLVLMREEIRLIPVAP